MNTHKRSAPSFGPHPELAVDSDGGETWTNRTVPAEVEYTLENKGDDAGVAGDAKTELDEVTDKDFAAQHKGADGDDSLATPDESLDDALKYVLTIPEAQQKITEARRKAPSDRSMQRYVSDPTHVLKGMKVSTTQGQEYLINTESLDQYITSMPIMLKVSAVPTVTPSGDAGDANAEKEDEATEQASGADTTDNANEATTGTESRTVGSLLAQNGKLLGSMEGKDELIKSQSEMIGFLKDELVSNRNHRGEVAKISRDMLTVLENIALHGGKENRVLPTVKVDSSAETGDNVSEHSQ